MIRSLLVFLALFGTGMTRHAPAPAMTSTPEPVSPFPVPTPSFSLVAGPRVVFQPVAYYTTPLERIKIAEAEGFVADMTASPCFRNFLVNRKLIQTDGRTPVQVADHIQTLGGVIPVEFYVGKSSVVAYRNPPDTTIHINRAVYAGDFDSVELAGTFQHEGLGHVLGDYGHDFEWSPSRSFSVPYTMGGADSAQGGDVWHACFNTVFPKNK